ncbi:sulfatase-like hydrolase/transferase [Roseimaritima ulvae]|uniref:sulfatase-like hydrolase/transferase n=1 Tax=Roseimaritima ulvae TaxID=980254 RepID=UPI0011CEC2B6|nr:sulfatase-like hydrolase/transferase [Roseimaritima ulvae]
MMKLLPILLCVLLCNLPLAIGENAKPNILFIAIDDLNDYISPLDNQAGVKTPNFDRLARRSVTFANAHCAAPVCHASRVSMMTGVHPVTSGLYNNLFKAHGPRWRHESPALTDAVVLSQHFRNHGYHAGPAAARFSTPCSGRPAIRKTIPTPGTITAAIRWIRSPPIGLAPSEFLTPKLG